MDEILALRENQRFVDMMSKAETASDIRNVFSEFGIDLSEAEAEKIVVAARGSEIDVETLEQITGGGISGDIYSAAKNTCVFLVSWAWQTGKNAVNVIRNYGKKR